MKKKLMILGASELQLPAIECANKLGIETIVLDYDPNAIGKDMARKFYEVSTLDYKKVLDIAIKEKINGVMTICSDKPMPVIAKVGEKLNLCTISYDTAMNATDKGLMRLALRKNEVPIPQFFICKTYEEFLEAINSIDGKSIIKPSNNSGSRGIHIFDGSGDKKEIYNYSRMFSSDKIILVEEFMEGPEVSVEIFVVNGKIHIIQITDKVTTGEPYFVEMIHSQPTALSFKVQNDIKLVASQGVKALGIYNGPAHVEIKITSSGAKIVEIGARLGGDHITTELVPLSTGIDIVKMNVLFAMSNEIMFGERDNKASMIYYFTHEEYINIDRKKLAIIKKIDKIYDIKLMKEANKIVKDIKSSNDRYGYMIIYGETIKDIYIVLKKVRNILNEV